MRGRVNIDSTLARGCTDHQNPKTETGRRNGIFSTQRCFFNLGWGESKGGRLVIVNGLLGQLQEGVLVV